MIQHRDSHDPSQLHVARLFVHTTDPGDIGFDPLGLKPTDPTEFATMQTKELQQGRLAMLGIAGMVAQELVDKKPILLEDFAIGMGLPA